VSGQLTGGGLRALPASEEDPLIAAIRSLLPERSAEDRVHGEIPVTFGHNAETIRIPVLPSRTNRAWQDKFRAAARKLFADLEADDTGAVMLALITGATDLQLELLEAYNPERLARSWVEDHATEEQILDAFLQVTAAAFPFPVTLARVVLANRQVAQWVRLELVRLLYSSSTSSSPPSTDGPQKRSKAN
jgi:hypothetical protein